MFFSKMLYLNRHVYACLFLCIKKESNEYSLNDFSLLPVFHVAVVF